MVSGVGTGGTLVGLFAGLRENGCRVTPVLARPVNLTGEGDGLCLSLTEADGDAWQIVEAARRSSQGA